MKALTLVAVIVLAGCARGKHPILVAEERTLKCEIMLAECVRGLQPSPLDYRTDEDGGTH